MLTFEEGYAELETLEVVLEDAVLFEVELVEFVVLEPLMRSPWLL